MPSRRTFLTVGAAGIAGAALPHALRGHGLDASPRAGGESPARHPLSILILGGTSFLGPHQIAYALGRGHSVTTFTRGRTEPTMHRSLFRDVEALIGDREDDLSALRGRRWDAVIDNSGREVDWTRRSAALLRDRVDQYMYTSSTGVFYPYLGDDISEATAPLLEAPVGPDGEVNGAAAYGVMKANSELAAIEAFGADRTTVVRPTYIMGPGDPTDRFTYWPVRLDLGGTVLVPGRADDPVQYIDVRDLTAWMIRLLEQGTAGTFNAAGPVSRTGMNRFVHGAHAAVSSPAEFVAVDDYDFLREHGVSFTVPWIMPVGDNYGSARVNNGHAIAHGLTFRPLAESVRDTLEWWKSDAYPEERRERMLSGERSLITREAAILEAWSRR